MRTSMFRATFLIVGGLFANGADLPDGPGKVTVQRVCGTCHGAQIVMGKKADKEGWERIVGNMIDKGATGTDAEFEQVVTYLTAHFPDDTPATINVNTATSKELAATLEIPSDLADAIVKYRRDNGKFKSAEDLRQVPGLSAKKIEEKKSLLTF